MHDAQQFGTLFPNLAFLQFDGWLHASQDASVIVKEPSKGSVSSYIQDGVDRPDGQLFFLGSHGLPLQLVGAVHLGLFPVK
jgi:hypothetical protein